jgi:hypothetical protein
MISCFHPPFTLTPFCEQRPMYAEGNEPRLCGFCTLIGMSKRLAVQNKMVSDYKPE